MSEHEDGRGDLRQGLIGGIKQFREMILDSTDNFGKYTCLHERFAQVAEFLARVDLVGMADGQYELDGTNLYLTVGTHALRRRQEAALEAHDNYVDIQVVISGEEGFGWRFRKECAAPRGEMDREKDIIFYDDTPSASVRAHGGQFVIFFPDDAHAPLTECGEGCGKVRKLVFKIKQ